MRDMAIVAGPLFGVLTDTVDDIAINVHYWPGDEPAAEEVMDIAQGALTAFNATFGPYPFAELDIMETFMASAMEYPGLILVNNDNWERGNPFMENATAHEIGHQWFYSVIGSDQISHPWIDESLTSFTEYVYYRHFRGEDRFKEVLQGDRDIYNFYKGTGAPDLVLNLPVTSYVDNNYGMIIYVKGPLFYIELENTVGREKFQEALQLYFQRHRYELVRSEDVLAAFEDATGNDLDALFYAWVGDFAGLDPSAKAEVDARRQ
jgi:aminopeptidase N